MKRKLYPILVSLVIIVPNLFSVFAGVESFPFTCAPMFGHYIDENTDLFVFKFEGQKGSKKTDLVNYFGKPENHFIRHFFSKVYGSTDEITPFSNRLSDSPEEFQHRMNVFFEHYSTFLKTEYKKSYDKISLQVKKVDFERNDLTNYESVGYYDSKNKKYYSILKNEE